MGLGVVEVGEELDRAGVDVARLARERDRLRAEALAQLRRDGGGGGLLDDLLVAALERALALAEVDDVAVRVADHLHLDVAGAGEEALDEHAVAAEARQRLPPGRGQRLLEITGAVDDAHSAAAAAGRGLDQQGIGDAVVARRLLGVALEDRDAGADGGLLRAHLVADQVDRLGRRPDEHQPGVAARARQPGVLRQEAVARVDRLRAAAQRRRDDVLDRQVGLDAQRGVGLADVRRRAVGVRVERDRPDAQAPQRPDQPPGDLAAVGDHDAREGHRRAARGRPHELNRTAGAPSRGGRCS